MNRRCAVGDATPKHAGNCRHAHPPASTNTTAVNTARSSTGARSAPCRRTPNPGNNGTTNSHRRSDTNRPDSASPTTTGRRTTGQVTPYETQACRHGRNSARSQAPRDPGVIFGDDVTYR
nr:Hypothetical protein [Embleya hyalina]